MDFIKTLLRKIRTPKFTIDLRILNYIGRNLRRDLLKYNPYVNGEIL